MASLDILCTEIEKEVEKVAIKLTPKIKEIMKRYANLIIDEIKIKAPIGNSKNHMKDSFIFTEKGNDEDYEVIIHSSTKGPLLHLIEFGFLHRSGVYVKAQPFLRPAYDKYIEAMLKEISEEIGK